MLWEFVIGAAGAIAFAIALVLLGAASLVRERSVPADGSADKYRTPHPVLNSAIGLSICLGIVATVLRMGAMT